MCIELAKLSFWQCKTVERFHVQEGRIDLKMTFLPLPPAGMCVTTNCKLFSEPGNIHNQC